MPWWIDRSRRVRHYISRLEVWELERFGRSGLAVVSRHSVLVLATTGRRTGALRKTPVSYMPYEDGYLIGGGGAGQKATPDWVLNLRANPRATLTLGRRRFDVVASEPVGEDRDRAYAAHVAKWPEALRYERWSGRPLPLFFLKPV